ncbi:MAG: TPM domain-containing protein [Planctomyces sp.]|nr:TPM domain-containing protein [Planctomyces sp.]
MASIFNHPAMGIVTLSIGCMTQLITTMPSAVADVILLQRPAAGHFVVDAAGLIEDSTEKSLDQTCSSLQQDAGVPIYIVTIRRMSDYQSGPDRKTHNIESFAVQLLSQWDFDINDQATGAKSILFLVSHDDRLARIELGNGWNHRVDDQCGRIMNERIVPEFRSGRYEAGISAGVTSLAQMVRSGSQDGGLQNNKVIGSPQFSPSQTRRPFGSFSLRDQVLIWSTIIGLTVFTVVSISRHGSDGWAWTFWKYVFIILGIIIIAMLTSRRRSGWRYGGYSSRSGFGGGFGGGRRSSGGGATGSW